MELLASFHFLIMLIVHYSSRLKSTQLARQDRELRATNAHPQCDSLTADQLLSSFSTTAVRELVGGWDMLGMQTHKRMI